MCVWKISCQSVLRSSHVVVGGKIKLPHILRSSAENMSGTLEKKSNRLFLEFPQGDTLRTKIKKNWVKLLVNLQAFFSPFLFMVSTAL